MPSVTQSWSNSVPEQTLHVSENVLLLERDALRSKFCIFSIVVKSRES